LNSDEFFKARALVEREQAIVKMEKKKQKQLLLLDLEKEVRALIDRKGACTVESANSRAYSKADVKLLCKWKGAKNAKVNGKIPDKKSDFAELYFATPDPPAPKPWTDQDEESLQFLKEEDVPLEETQLGVAAWQMAVATDNNMEKLDRDTCNKLLQSIAAFDRTNNNTS